jgi:PAS domain S-box-containing protein
MSAKHLVTVLVVDDEAVVNELIKSQVRKLGYAVAGSAFDAQEAVALACQLRPSVVLMDIQMTDPRTGLEDELAGVAAAGEIQRRCPLPVILLSAHESADLVRKASAAGVAAYLVKPVHENDLDRAITMALARFGDLMALREAEERFRTFADFTYDWELWIDPEGAIVTMSPSCERVTGYTRSEFLADPALMDRVLHPDDRERVRAAMRASHATDGSCAVDFRIVHKSGEQRWIAHACQPVNGRDGKPLGRRVTNRDITERKLMEDRLRSALAEKERLLTDVSEEMRHTLHLISSLLSLQGESAGSPDAEALFHGAQARVRTVACMHERLERVGNSTVVDFASCAHGILEPLLREAAGKSVDVNVEIEAVQVGIEVATPCGLILNELASNALRHAFPGGREGMVTVTLRSPRRGEYVLTVQDNGVGLPEKVDLQNPATLGLRLVRVLADQVGGTVTRNPGEGTTVIVTFREKDARTPV